MVAGEAKGAVVGPAGAAVVGDGDVGGGAGAGTEAATDAVGR